MSGPRVRYIGRGGEAQVYKFDWFDLVVVVSTTAQQLSQVVTNSLDIVDDLARAHANYRRQRAEWAAETLKEIESL